MSWRQIVGLLALCAIVLFVFLPRRKRNPRNDRADPTDIWRRDANMNVDGHPGAGDFGSHHEHGGGHDGH